jgi:hypothetical protein
MFIKNEIKDRKIVHIYPNYPKLGFIDFFTNAEASAVIPRVKKTLLLKSAKNVSHILSTSITCRDIQISNVLYNSATSKWLSRAILNIVKIKLT